MLNKDVELTPKESIIVENLLKLSGRQDRLYRSSILTPTQVGGVRAILPILHSSTKKGMKDESKCDLINRLLLTLGIKPISYNFFRVVFDDIDFSKEMEVEDRVHKFQCLCMLEYGNFRYGYKILKNNKILQDLWSKYFPTHEEVKKRAQDFAARPGPVGLIDISPSQLFALGYLASDQAKKINGARKILKKLLESALSKGAKDFADLLTIAEKMDIKNLGAFVAQAGIPGIEKLLYPQLHAPRVSYPAILHEVKEHCITVDDSAITQAQHEGRQNADTYLAMHDVDVYVATSMREALHFTTNWAFVNNLFKGGELKDWGIRYFDPTQSYLPDRIQKGLMECLMIKRARVTIYNAQESDTFGKDAEAAVSLAQGKNLIVYVTRLFERNVNLEKLYSCIDRAPRIERDKFIGDLESEEYLKRDDAINLSAPDKTKADVIEYVIKQVVPKFLQSVEINQIMAELQIQGYHPPEDHRKLVEYTTERIVSLEKRALMFREVHPLSLQASPLDGVARGVMVTRTVKDTAKLLSGLLLGTLEYDVIEKDENWILIDRITLSPVRVVTKNPVITTAFWSVYSEESRKSISN